MTFQPGQSGNPNGRPKNIVDKRTELRRLLEPHANDLVNKLVELARAGEPTALKLCIERLLPRVKPDNSIYFELPEGRLDTDDNILQITHDITRAVASGQMTIEEANKFTVFLEHQRWAIEAAECREKDGPLTELLKLS